MREIPFWAYCYVCDEATAQVSVLTGREPVRLPTHEHETTVRCNADPVETGPYVVAAGTPVEAAVTAEGRPYVITGGYDLSVPAPLLAPVIAPRNRR